MVDNLRLFRDCFFNGNTAGSLYRLMLYGRSVFPAVIEIGAPPERTLILTVGMCGLCTVKRSAHTANDPCGERRRTAVSPTQCGPTPDFFLHHIEHNGGYDGLVPIFNIILCDFALVLFLSLVEEIHRK